MGMHSVLVSLSSKYYETFYFFFYNFKEMNCESRNDGNGSAVSAFY